MWCIHLYNVFNHRALIINTFWNRMEHRHYAFSQKSALQGKTRKHRQEEANILQLPHGVHCTTRVITRSDPWLHWLIYSQPAAELLQSNHSNLCADRISSLTLYSDSLWAAHCVAWRTGWGLGRSVLHDKHLFSILISTGTNMQGAFGSCWNINMLRTGCVMTNTTDQAEGPETVRHGSLYLPHVSSQVNSCRAPSVKKRNKKRSAAFI